MEKKTAKTEEILMQELQEASKEKMKDVQERVNTFLKELETEGFGLDATVTVGRQGNTPNIFVVRIR